MADHDDGSKLESAVDAILAKKEMETFAEYWNLAKGPIKGVPVRACYARTAWSIATSKAKTHPNWNRRCLSVCM